MCRSLCDSYNKSANSLPGQPPTTPQEYIDMITDHHIETRIKRFGSSITNEKCRKSCNKAIPAVKCTNKLGNQTRVSDPLTTNSHNAIRISKKVEAIMSAGPERATNEQLDAITTFKGLLEDDADDSLLRRLGHADARRVGTDQMKQLIKLFSIIFFRDHRMELGFTWEAPLGYYGRYIHDPDGLSNIEMSALQFSVQPPFRRLTGRAVGRLSIILHEIVHAYLYHYACDCPSSGKDVDAFEGHGQAWQQIASFLERNAPRFICIPLILGRFDAIRSNWVLPLYWPPKKEVVKWDLDSQ
jgi:hypothetical protein